MAVSRRSSRRDWVRATCSWAEARFLPGSRTVLTGRFGHIAVDKPLQGGDLLSPTVWLRRSGPRIAGQFSPQHEQRLLNMVQAFPQPGVAGRGVADAQLGYQFIDGAVGLDANMVFLDGLPPYRAVVPLSPVRV